MADHCIHAFIKLDKFCPYRATFYLFVFYRAFVPSGTDMTS
jgi:hypothetical protein